MRKPTSKNFRAWFKRNLKDCSRDIALHGADGGFPYITYTTDTVKIYDAYEREIYDMLREDAEEFGFKSIDELTASFSRSDMLDDPDRRKNLLVWYACERVARELNPNL